jgi:DNA polymerase-4
MFEIVPNRKIIHIDMDAFYVEQLDNPLCEVNLSLWVVLKTGAVAAASYEARRCKSAMSGFIAKKNCPDLIFVSPRFDRYKEIE